MKNEITKTPTVQDFVSALNRGEEALLEAAKILCDMVDQDPKTYEKINRETGIHWNVLANLERVGVHKFIGGDDPFTFITDVHQNFLRADFDDLAFDNFACCKTHRALLHGFFHREHNYSGLNCGRLGRPLKRTSKTPLPNYRTLPWQRRVEC